MKTLFVFLIALLAVSFSFGQSVSPEVTASGGDHFTNASVHVSWTVGEAVIETFDSGSDQLTQGFHQTNLMVTAVEDLAQNIDLKVFPNPTPGLVNIEVSEFPGQLNLSVIDVLGRQLLFKENIIHNTRFTIDLSDYASGSYFLYISDQQFQPIKTFKILKNK